jgi:hypothetical protein
MQALYWDGHELSLNLSYPALIERIYPLRVVLKRSRTELEARRERFCCSLSQSAIHHKSIHPVLAGSFVCRGINMALRLRRKRSKDLFRLCSAQLLREFDKMAVGVADVGRPLSPETIRWRHDR